MDNKTQASLMDVDFDFVDTVIKNIDNEDKHIDSIYKLILLFRKKWDKEFPNAGNVLEAHLKYNSWETLKILSRKLYVLTEKTT